MQLGRIYGNRNDMRDECMAAIERACAIDPSYVDNSPITAHRRFVYLPREPMKKAQRIAHCYEWLRTRTDEMIERSVRRPSVSRFDSHFAPIRYGSKFSDRYLQMEAKTLRSSLRSVRELSCARSRLRRR